MSGRISVASNRGEEIVTEELNVENDRLKTTLQILTQKLKVKDDDHNQFSDNLESEIKLLKQQASVLQSYNEKYKQEIEMHKNDIEVVGNSTDEITKELR